VIAKDMARARLRVALVLHVGLIHAFQMVGSACKHDAWSRSLLTPRATAPRLYTPIGGESLVDQAVRRATAESNAKNIIHGLLGDVSFRTGPLYRSWRGTALKLTWRSILLNTVFAACISTFVQASLQVPLGTATVSQVMIPRPDHPIVATLAPLYLIWTHHVTLTTFILTFFVSESFSYWRRTLCVSRKIQRALVSIILLQSTHAARDAAGSITTVARQALDRTASELRLLQIMFWGSICRGKTVGLVHTDEGMQRLLERGVMSREQHDLLVPLNYTDRYEEVLRWIAARLVAMQGRDKAAPERSPQLEPGSYDFERRFDDQTIELRDQCDLLQTDMAGRMPLAYVHLVQLLVDSLVVLTAPALYSKLGPLSICLTFWVTVCYRGLLELSKCFLDAFGFHSPGEQPIEVDVLMSEVNHALQRTSQGSPSLPTPAAFARPTDLLSPRTSQLSSQRLRMDSELAGVVVPVTDTR